MSAGFDTTEIEDILQERARRALGGGITFYESRVPGVVAVERLTWSDVDKMDWQTTAEELAHRTGLGVVCVADCDWGFDDSHDEEATLIAFDVPDLPQDYRDDHRNLIHPVQAPGFRP